VPGSRERELARALAAVLDGVQPAVGEAGALASVLTRAAGSARVEVPAAEVEAALDRSRRLLPEQGRRRIPRLALALAGVAAAAAAVVVVVVVSPFSGAPGLDVGARAAEALGDAETVLAVTQHVRPAEPGTFPASTREGWLDLFEGRAHWMQRVEGRLVAETLVEPGSVQHYLPPQDALITAGSCAAFATGCTELVDPIAFYREALAAADGPDVSDATLDGRQAYRLVLPVQALPDTARIEQVVFLDAQTYLPLRIVWRDIPDTGPPRPFAVIDIDSIRRVAREDVPADAFALEVPAEIDIVERTESGDAVGGRTLTVEEARRLSPPLFWLGETFQGARLSEISELRFEQGTVYRVRYGDFTVWNYTSVTPPDIQAGKSVEPKVVPLPAGGVARFYFGPDGIVVGELETANRSVAVIGPEAEKSDLFAALEQLEPLQ
jgi:hypothetical protein